jgi:hypothetical protein
METPIQRHGLHRTTGTRASFKAHLTRDNVYINRVTAAKKGRILGALTALCRDFRAFSEKNVFTLPPTHNATRERASPLITQTTGDLSPASSSTRWR